MFMEECFEQGNFVLSAEKIASVLMKDQWFYLFVYFLIFGLWF